MGQRFQSGHGPDEMMLMPADPREWLPAGHLAWKVLELAGEMDLSGFGGYRPDGQGGRPYDPVMMATLLLYCYCRGRRSAREIEAATFDDVGARIIAGGLHPDHSTIARFTGRNAAAVLALLPESVRACAAEGLVDLSVVAGDGTKLKANAAMSGNLTREQLEGQIAELEGWIDAEFGSWVRDLLDAEGIPVPDDDPAAAGGGGPGPGRGGGAGTRKKWKKPDRAAQMLRRRLAARARLDAAAGRQQDRAEARAAALAARLERSEAACARREEKVRARLEARARREAAGEKIPGARPITSPDQDRDLRELRAARDKIRRRHAEAAAAAPPAGPRATVNPADPSSLVMPLKKGGFDQLFNVQALATAKTQVILAVIRHPSPVDVQALLPLLAAARAVLRQAGLAGEILTALFDTGYASDANFTADIPETLYVAVTREARQAGRSPDGRGPAMLPSWQDMTSRLDTDEGKALYKQRSATIEPVFAQLTARLGRTLNYRGHLADAELALWAASHNILKAITARTRRTAPAPAA
ncbi:MAG TPA: transposase [Trebonia sp.]|nr:transposase [Trebonia sp.]